MSRHSKSKRPDADIYALADPVTLQVRYIGLAVDLTARIRMHFYEARRSESPKNVWLRSLGDARPVVTILETVPRSEACVRERYWIALYRRLGAHLTNLTDGGESTLGWVPSAETRARIGAANRGRPCSEAAKAKISEFGKAYWRSPEGRAYRSRTAPRKPIDDEQRRRMVAGLRRAYQDPDSKASCARRAHGEQKKGLKGHSPSPEARARMSLAQKGRVFTPEHRAKIKAAAIARWDREKSA